VSGLGETAQDIMINALFLVEAQIMGTGNTPVGILTAEKVIKIDDKIWAKVVDHVRLFGEQSAQLVSDQDFSACGDEEQPEKFYIGATEVATVIFEGNEKVFNIMHSRVPEEIFNKFITEVAERSRSEKEARGEAASAVDLTKLRKDVEVLRKQVEDEAISKCQELRTDCTGLLVGYVTTEEKFGYQHDTFHPVGDKLEDAYQQIRGGAKPIFDGEHNTLRNVSEEYVSEKHYIGATKICVHHVDRLDTNNKKKKQFYIFDKAVPLTDYHHFLTRLSKMEAVVRVTRDKKAIENIYWAGKPKKKSEEVPIFGFD
jgi:hypothetical protein